LACASADLRVRMNAWNDGATDETRMAMHRRVSRFTDFALFAVDSPFNSRRPRATPRAAFDASILN